MHSWIRGQQAHPVLAPAGRDFAFADRVIDFSLDVGVGGGGFDLTFIRLVRT
ncbi:hypothetical protein H7H80_15970 [Mycobacterium interjectum]|nr:hypothetical protein [Mycobacterium interjectum]